MSDMSKAEIAYLSEFASRIQQATEELLTDSDEFAPADRIRAIEACVKVHDYMTADKVRKRVTLINIEAANYLAGAYADQVVELSEWSEGAESKEELSMKAAEVLKAHKHHFV